LLAWEAEGSYELLERAIPGTTLADSAPDDDEATRILVRSMPPLWVEPPDDPALVTLARWGRGLGAYVDAYPGGDGPMPHDLVVRARDTYAEMLATSPAPRVLHGDLHHGNLLSATREPWLVIDPKGVIGDPAFEVSPLFFNPWAVLRRTDDIPALMRRRYAIVCEELDLDPHRIAAWGFARAVLSQCWTVEEADGIEPHMVAVAEALWELV
jgi:streptomycin 6-kinase